MLAALTYAQAALAVAVLALVGERFYLLCWQAPLAPRLAELARSTARAARPELAAALGVRPASHAARLLAEAEAPEGDLDQLLFDLRAEATARFAALRVLATLSSTLGLLTGIVALSVGFDPQSAGLLALEAGRPEKLAMGHALTAMAIGVGGSGLCFYALGRLRPLAQRLIRDDTRLVSALRGH